MASNDVRMVIEWCLQPTCIRSWQRRVWSDNHIHHHHHNQKELFSITKPIQNQSDLMPSLQSDFDVQHADLLPRD